MRHARTATGYGWGVSIAVVKQQCKKRQGELLPDALAKNLRDRWLQVLVVLIGDVCRPEASPQRDSVRGRQGECDACFHFDASLPSER